MNPHPGYLLKQVQHALRLSMDGALREIGLTTAQYAALSALETRSDASNADLARACFVTPQTMIEILQGLQQAGFIVRRPHPHNRRIITATMTGAGIARLASAHKAVYEIEVRMVENLTANEQSKLVELLARCYRNLTGERL